MVRVLSWIPLQVGILHHVACQLDAVALEDVSDDIRNMGCGFIERDG